LSCSLLLRPPPSSTLFPYTTLFRSRLPPDELRRLRHAGARARLRHQRLRRDPPRAVRVGRQAAGHELRPRRPLAGLRRRRPAARSEEHTSELQSLTNLVCRLLLVKK